MECVIFTGLQASGKSNFFKRFFFNTHVRVSLDLLKTRNREKKLLEFCLTTNQKFVVDNTNPMIDDRKKYIIPARANKFIITGYYFESKIKDCLERNEHRECDEKISEKGILSTYNKLEIPSIEEGYDKLYYVSIKGNEYIIEEWKNEI